MKLLLVVLAVGLTAAIDPTTYDFKSASHKQITLYDIRDWVEALENDFYGLVDEVSDLNTLIQVAQERLNFIYDHFLPHIRLVNRQQDELIESIRKQLKKLQHIVDEMRAAVMSVSFIAENTRDELISLKTAISEIRTRNDEQDGEIYKVEVDAADCKQAFLDNLASNITSLETRHIDVQLHVYRIRSFVQKRKCEYGHGFAPLDSETEIKFKTKFGEVPQVAVVMNGFFAHLDGYGKKAKYNEYLIYKDVSSIDVDSFTLVVKDLSHGQVTGKVMSCVWMACQSLDEDFID